MIAETSNPCLQYLHHRRDSDPAQRIHPKVQPSLLFQEISHVYIQTRTTTEVQKLSKLRLTSYIHQPPRKPTRSPRPFNMSLSMLTRTLTCAIPRSNGDIPRTSPGNG